MIAVATIAASPAAGPLTPIFDPLSAPTTIPPTIPAINPEKRGAPLANAIPKHRKNAGKITFDFTKKQNKKKQRKNISAMFPILAIS